jgi:hypothetical protein
MVALGILSCLFLTACGLFGPGKEETEMLSKVKVGSDFSENHQKLSNAGWLMSSDKQCIVGGTSEPDHWYFRESDPTYNLILTYNKKCKLDNVRLERRKGTEL